MHETVSNIWFFFCFVFSLIECPVCIFNPLSAKLSVVRERGVRWRLKKKSFLTQWSYAILNINIISSRLMLRSRDRRREREIETSNNKQKWGKFGEIFLRKIFFHHFFYVTYWLRDWCDGCVRYTPLHIYEWMNEWILI